MARLDDWKARFPELTASAGNPTGFTDEKITAAYDDVDAIYAADDAAKAYAVAHWLSYETPGGEVISQSPSGASIATTTTPIADPGSDSFWAATAYGTKFLMLRRNESAFSLRVL